MSDERNPALDSRFVALTELPVIPVTSTTLDDDQLRAACASVERLPFWTLTHNPKDHPGKWVARLGFGWEPTEITQNAVMGDTREEVEARIPFMEQGRWTFFGRMDGDEPQVVGVWM